MNKLNIGKTISFEAEPDVIGTITDETETAVFVTSSFFTGWIDKDSETETGETLAEFLSPIQNQ